jgi:hypothetical protein
MSKPITIPKYKGNYKGKVKVHTTTVWKSRYVLDIFSYGLHKLMFNEPKPDQLVQDIKTDLENPVLCLGARTVYYPYWSVKDREIHPIKQQKGDWNEWHKDMESFNTVKMPDPVGYFAEHPPIENPLWANSPKKKKKPLRNWLTRIKRKVKRWT